MRIIPQALWDQVQARRQAQALGHINNGRVRVGRGPKYLLSGLLKCDICESNFVVADYYRYACRGHLNRGPSVCHNSFRVSRKLAEERCLAALREELFTTDAIERIIKKTSRLLAEYNRYRQPELERNRLRLGEVEQEIENIMKAIRRGILTVSTKAELEKVEAERALLKESIKSSVAAVDKVVMLLPRVVERYRAVVDDLGNLTGRHLAQAREHIRILVGEIRLTDGRWPPGSHHGRAL